MKKLPYIIVGVLLVVAIVSIVFSGSEKPNEINITQVPTNIPTNILTSSPPKEILGEETQQIPNATKATILTNKGKIVIELFSEAAPDTVKNFSEKAVSGFYNGLTFHRIEDWVAQGGDPLGTGAGGGKMPTELNNNPFIRGSLGIARKNDIKISNDAQFFITKTDASWLDGQYTNFGQVSEGMDVVDSLEIGDTITSITVE